MRIEHFDGYRVGDVEEDHSILPFLRCRHLNPYAAGGIFGQHKKMQKI